MAETPETLEEALRISGVAAHYDLGAPRMVAGHLLNLHNVATGAVVAWRKDKARIVELERAANLACDSVFRLTSAVMSSGRGADCANALRALDIVASDLRVAARGGEQSEIGCNGRALP